MQAIWARIKELFEKIPQKHRKQLLILVSVVIALAITVGILVTRTNWVIIASGENAPTVDAALREMGVDTRIEGSAVLVPEEQRDALTMQLREQGVIGLGDFDRGAYMADATGFGVTAAHANQLYGFQLGADIRRQLLQMDFIHDALVIVERGESSPFRIATNLRHASASVILTLRGQTLTPGQVQSVAGIVRGSVPGIADDDIVITDNAGNIYRIGDDVLDFDSIVSQRLALENMFTDNIKNQIEELLRPVFGPGNIQVQPFVRLNFDDVVTEEVEFAPPIPGELDGIVRSIEEITEMSRRLDTAEGIPGTDSNAMGMGAPEYPWGPADDGMEYWRMVSGRNYEMNELRTRIDQAQGVVESASISVLINSENEFIDWEIIDNAVLTDVVARAVGIPGGNVELHRIPFGYEDTTLADAMAAWEAIEAQRRMSELIDTIIMYGVILLLGVMVFLLGRVIVKALKPPPEPEPLLVAGPDGFDITIDDDDYDYGDLSGEPELEEIGVTQKSPGLEQIESFIEKDAASVAQLLRNWLSDD